MGLAEFLQWNLTLFLLILSRWAGMIMLAPVFGARGVPAMVKLGLAVSISIILYPLIMAAGPQIPSETLPYAALLIKEIVVGLVIGFVIYAITAVLEGAGQLIDMQMGFNMSGAIDPIFGVQSAMMGNFQMILAIMLLLATNSHHYLIAAMVKSYTYVPINPGALPQGLNYYIFLIREIFTLSVQLALPVIGALVLTDIGVGLLMRTVPQMNIFTVIFPVKIIFGFTILFLGIGFFGETVNMLFERAMTWLLELYKGWQGT
ncbi:flagellar biosynthetic protein FliR [Desulfitobacterium sp. LBE]|uniref:Flagellar biosynthetic protein FliR n=5 Tax=root TaxID=1 RepID=Q24T77_DESHY|nr:MULTISPECIES: flagellar biosynthetic protein FliR [Desulfitobacterium]ACL22145.1 flagellar biosynthetic protein FliR [Desulfitobacterium hafniense DCB-2]EHL04576.1 flagellar biosynthetic protein FliR [Desulfitobacterium hafniense DP7]MEA5021280.1 flagellar biosynthetic protein FliR [Desulfitobacterium hafniense]TWH60074.1 flagellar biosynthetic protein FliR [Desulfitobacterium sp. LBE]SHN81054.1 flagellar biosynthetic protein FliR [Desulfitobacterium chlororespirans DSM 11544]